uniref:CIMAP1 family member D n=1 Tax=Salmo trutta TaxID=8032 RepID=A0A674BTW5_SALTR
ISHDFTKPTSPAYSFHGRISNNCEYYRGLFQTPGLGAYSPENAPPCNIQCRPPSYNMCFHTRSSSDSAPNKHCLPALMEGMSKTPGPGRYNSTDPSVYMPRQPAFSMLGHHGFPNDATLKPGPGTRNPEKVIVHKPRAPAFSLGIKHRVCHPTAELLTIS